AMASGVQGPGGSSASDPIGWVSALSHTGITRVWIECWLKRRAHAVKPRLQIVDSSIHSDPHRVGIGIVGTGARSMRRQPLGDQDELDRIREPLLRPFGRRFEAPDRVALYLFDDGSWVIENFNEGPVTVRLDGQPHPVAGRGWIRWWR